MTPEQISAWTGLGTMIGLVLVGIMNRLDARKAISTARAAATASEASAKVSGQIHALVNSSMLHQLKLNMLQAQRIAELTKDKTTGLADLALAIEAERIYNAHKAKQSAMDALEGTQI